MSDEEINVAIAEACGWRQSELSSPNVYWHDKHSWRFSNDLPNYVGDLNAMASAEEKMDAEQTGYYLSNLCLITGCQIPFSATARQRAIAFLKTLSKWKD